MQLGQMVEKTWGHHHMQWRTGCADPDGGRPNLPQRLMEGPLLISSVELGPGPTCCSALVCFSMNYIQYLCFFGPDMTPHTCFSPADRSGPGGTGSIGVIVGLIVAGVAAAAGLSFCRKQKPQSPDSFQPPDDQD